MYALAHTMLTHTHTLTHDHLLTPTLTSLLTQWSHTHPHPHSLTQGDAVELVPVTQQPSDTVYLATTHDMKQSVTLSAIVSFPTSLRRDIRNSSTLVQVYNDIVYQTLKDAVLSVKGKGHLFLVYMITLCVNLWLQLYSIIMFFGFQKIYHCFKVILKSLDKDTLFQQLSVSGHSVPNLSQLRKTCNMKQILQAFKILFSHQLPCSIVKGVKVTLPCNDNFA